MNNLPKNEFDQKLVTGFCDETEVDYLEQNKISLPHVKIYGFGRRVSFFSDISALLAIRREIQSFEPHIIHTHTAKAGFLGRLAAMSTFKKQIRIHTFHGHLLEGYFGTLKTYFIVLVERFLSRYTNTLVSVGIKVKLDLLKAKIGNEEKFRVIGPGLKLKEIPDRNSSLVSLNLDERNFSIVWIGRVVEVKAPIRIIEVAIETVSQNLNVHFYVVGDGPLLGQLKEEVNSLNLPVTFLGWQSEIEKILSFSDLVMLTSKNEGTPVALIQAQMAGVPVLSSDVGSVPEVLINNKTGYYMPYSPKDFTDRIRLLSEDYELRQSLGNLAKSFANEKYSLEKFVSNYRDLYKELINQSNSSPKALA
jgi:glycosyltransferase involved in cell wall biosynthesis